MHSEIYPNSAQPSGAADNFTDFGFRFPVPVIWATHKATLRGSYIYENQRWKASFRYGVIHRLWKPEVAEPE